MDIDKQILDSGPQGFVIELFYNKWETRKIILEWLYRQYVLKPNIYFLVVIQSSMFNKKQVLCFCEQNFFLLFWILKNGSGVCVWGGAQGSQVSTTLLSILNGASFN